MDDTAPSVLVGCRSDVTGVVDAASDSVVVGMSVGIGVTIVVELLLVRPGWMEIVSIDCYTCTAHKYLPYISITCMKLTCTHVHIYVHMR